MGGFLSRRIEPLRVERHLRHPKKLRQVNNSTKTRRYPLNIRLSTRPVNITSKSNRNISTNTNIERRGAISSTNRTANIVYNSETSNSIDNTITILEKKYMNNRVANDIDARPLNDESAALRGIKRMILLITEIVIPFKLMNMTDEAIDIAIDKAFDVVFPKPGYFQKEQWAHRRYLETAKFQYPDKPAMTIKDHVKFIVYMIKGKSNILMNLDTYPTDFKRYTAIQEQEPIQYNILHSSITFNFLNDPIKSVRENDSAAVYKQAKVDIIERSIYNPEYPNTICINDKYMVVHTKGGVSVPIVYNIFKKIININPVLFDPLIGLSNQAFIGELTFLYALNICGLTHEPYNFAFSALQNAHDTFKPFPPSYNRIYVNQDSAVLILPRRFIIVRDIDTIMTINQAKNKSYSIEDVRPGGRIEGIILDIYYISYLFNDGDNYYGTYTIVYREVDSINTKLFTLNEIDDIVAKGKIKYRGNKKDIVNTSVITGEPFAENYREGCNIRWIKLMTDMKASPYNLDKLKTLMNTAPINIASINNSNEGKLNALIGKDGNIRQINAEGKTAIMRAIIEGKESLLGTLILANSDINTTLGLKDKSGKTALQYAKELSNSPVKTRILKKLEGFDIKNQNQNTNTETPDASFIEPNYIPLPKPWIRKAPTPLINTGLLSSVSLPGLQKQSQPSEALPLPESAKEALPQPRWNPFSWVSSKPKPKNTGVPFSGVFPHAGNATPHSTTSRRGGDGTRRRKSRGHTKTRGTLRG